MNKSNFLLQHFCFFSIIFAILFPVLLRDNSIILPFAQAQNIPMRSLQITTKTHTVFVGETLQLSCRIKPDNTTNPALLYTISQPALASISSNGLIHPHKPGKVKITVESTDGSFLYGIFILQIKNKPPQKNISVNSAAERSSENSSPKISSQDSSAKKSSSNSSTKIPFRDSAAKKSSDNPSTKIPFGNSISLSSSGIIMDKNQCKKLKVISQGKEFSFQNQLTWKILDTSIATVDRGKITGKSPGITTLVVAVKKHPQICCSCSITVRYPDL